MSATINDLFSELIGILLFFCYQLSSLLTLGRVYMIIIKSIISTLTVIVMMCLYLALRNESRGTQVLGGGLNLLYTLLLVLVWWG